jgi:hypothetical protein
MKTKYAWESTGFFWLDESSNLPGTISYSPEAGSELRLMGTFDDALRDFTG